MGEADGEEVPILIDNGATRNFIDIGFIIRNNLPKKVVDVLYVTNANDHYTLCNKTIILNIKMGNYILENEFYIFPQDDLQ